MEAWSVGDVSRFLLDVGLEMHVGDFRTQLIDGGCASFSLSNFLTLIMLVFSLHA